MPFDLSCCKLKAGRSDVTSRVEPLTMQAIWIKLDLHVLLHCNFFIMRVIDNYFYSVLINKWMKNVASSQSDSLSLQIWQVYADAAFS